MSNVAPLLSAENVIAGLNEVRLLDATKDGRAVFEGEHVKTARYIDLEDDLTGEVDPANGGRHPLPTTDAWTATVKRLGITPSDHVVVYDRHGGGLAAARAWWMFRATGFACSVVDGGFDALQTAGAPLQTGRETSTPSAFLKPLQFASPQTTLSEVREGRALLVDARAEERFRGEHEPLDPIAGHIPGARNRFWKQNLDSRGHFLSPHVLREQWIALLAQQLPGDCVHQCGSGVTACHNLLALEIAGLFGGSLYVGSFSEWCHHEQVATTEST